MCKFPHYGNVEIANDTTMMLEEMPKNKDYDSRFINLILMTLFTTDELVKYSATGKVGKNKDSRPALSPRRKRIISGNIKKLYMPI
jgi:hypothetical protein